MVTYGWAKGTDALVDFNTVPHIGLDKPWWNSSASEQMEVDGMLTNTLSDFMITHRDGTVAMFFNKKLAENYQLENLYETVRNGKWTLDKFSECTKNVAVDLDGDGKMTDVDMYGYSALDSNSFTYLIYGAGEKLVTMDDDGKPKLDINNERFIRNIRKLLKLCKVTTSGTARSTTRTPVRTATSRSSAFSTKTGRSSCRTASVPQKNFAIWTTISAFCQPRNMTRRRKITRTSSTPENSW